MTQHGCDLGGCLEQADVVFSYDVFEDHAERDHHQLCFEHMEELWNSQLKIPGPIKHD